MDTLIVLLTVALAAAFLGRRLFMSWRASRSQGCASDCGCASAKQAPTSWDRTGVV
jgi:hypothetical protein